MADVSVRRPSDATLVTRPQRASRTLEWLRSQSRGCSTRRRAPGVAQRACASARQHLRRLCADRYRLTPRAALAPTSRSCAVGAQARLPGTTGYVELGDGDEAHRRRQEAGRLGRRERWAHRPLTQRHPRRRRPSRGSSRRRRRIGSQSRSGSTRRTGSSRRSARTPVLQTRARARARSRSTLVGRECGITAGGPCPCGRRVNRDDSSAFAEGAVPKGIVRSAGWSGVDERAARSSVRTRGLAASRGGRRSDSSEVVATALRAGRRSLLPSSVVRSVASAPTPHAQLWSAALHND